MERDVELRCASDFDFEVVGVDVDGRDELIEESALLGVGRLLPDRVPVELGEQLDDVIEPLGRFGSRLWFTLRAKGGELVGESLVFGVERLGDDLVGVVQLEQLALLGFEIGDLGASVRLEPAGVLAGLPAVLQTQNAPEKVEPPCLDEKWLLGSQQAVQSPSMLMAAAWTRGDVLGLIGVIIGAIGVVLGVVGFFVALAQLKRTAKAAEATRDALSRSNRTQLLMLLPQFRLAEMELDFAIADDRRELAARALANYSHLANEVSAVMQTYQLTDATTVAQIRESAASATRAKGEIYSKQSKSLTSICRPVLQELGAVVAVISDVRANLMVNHENGAASAAA